MATRRISSLEEEVEFSNKLYKSILNPFINSMPAVQLMEHPEISEKLLLEEMQKVRRKQDTEGSNAAARLLLETLKTKPDWFEAFIRVLDDEDLKLQLWKPKFLEIKDQVERDWVQDHPTAFQAVVCNPSAAWEPGLPTQSSEGIRRGAPCTEVPMTTDSPTGGASGVTDDFVLPTHPAPRSSAVRLQKDTVLESMEVDTTEGNLYPTRTAIPVSPETQGASAQPAEASGADEQYTDATSTSATAGNNIYETFQPAEEDEHEYTQLTNVCLETDACPVPQQPTDVPQPEAGVEAQPQVLTPQETRHRRRQRQRPRTREEHPSLCQAISREPAKDFDARPVIQELSLMEGWSDHDEEHRVIHIIRPHRNTDGYYVVWYWNLAKRPTICVAQGGKVITFVVHKSTSRPMKYYINRRQKRCSTLSELLRYHRTNGILYCPLGGQETTLWLTHPYTRE